MVSVILLDTDSLQWPVWPLNVDCWEDNSWIWRRPQCHIQWWQCWEAGAAYSDHEQWRREDGWRRRG